MCQKFFDSSICESKNQKPHFDAIHTIYEYDLPRFDINPPSPLVDEHRYFGTPLPNLLSVYVVYGWHLMQISTALVIIDLL